MTAVVNKDWCKLQENDTSTREFDEILAVLLFIADKNHRLCHQRS